MSLAHDDKITILSLFPDDICKQQGNQLWSCQKLSQCPTAQAGLKKGKRPETCSFIGNVPVVCCQPSVQDRQPTETKERISVQSECCS